MSLYDVAVPTTEAICVNLVQVDPWHRSILTSVWLAEPFVHVKPIELLEMAPALKLVGVAGKVGAFTMIDTMRGKLVRPKLSETTSDAVYVPGVEYRCVI